MADKRIYELSDQVYDATQYLALDKSGNTSAGKILASDFLTKTNVGLGNVENTALSTWAGTTNITTLGTISTGTWSGTAIAVAKGGTGQTSAGIAAFNAITGYTASGATGTTSTNLVFSTSPTLVTPAITTSATITRSAIGATSTDGAVLTNVTAAAAGAQQWSPRIRLTGQGWKTTSTAASQAVDWIVENQPVQGSTNPTTNLVFSSQVNAGGYAACMTLDSSGTLTATGDYIIAGTGGVGGLRNVGTIPTLFNGFAALVVTSARDLYLGAQNGQSVHFCRDANNNASPGVSTEWGAINNSVLTLSISTMQFTIVGDVGLGRSTAGKAQITNGTTTNYLVLGLDSGANSAITCPAAASGAGNVLTIYGSSAGSGNTNGGNINMQPGAKAGAGADGLWQVLAGTGAAVALTVASATGNITMKSAATLQLGNAAVTGLAAGVLAALTNASITITDSAGQLYRIPVII